MLKHMICGSRFRKPISVLILAVAFDTATQAAQQKVCGVEESALAQSGEPAPNSAPVAAALQSAAVCYQEHGQPARALALFQRALAVRMQLNGPRHLETGRLHWHIGNILAELRRDDDARKALSTALDIANAAEPEGLLTAKILNSLGEVDHTEQKFKPAEQYYWRAIELFKRLEGPRSVNVGVTLDNIAGIYSESGDLEKASDYRRQALETLKQAAGPESEEVASCLHNLGALYSRMGRYTDSESTFREALRIREMRLSAGDLRIAQTRYALAIALSWQGDYDESEQLFRAVLAQRQAALGPEHPDVANCLTQLGQLYLEHGQMAHAAPLLERALAIQRKSAGEVSQEAGLSWAALARLYMMQGAYEKAARCYAKALEIQRRLYGDEHMSTAITEANLAEVRRLQRRYAEAVALYRQVEPVFVKKLKPGHAQLAVLRQNMALVAAEQGDLKTARDWMSETFAELSKSLGADDPETAVAEHNLANVLDRSGQLTKAKFLHAEALQKLEAALGEDHPRTIAARRGVALNAWRMGGSAEARVQLLAAHRAVAGLWSANLLSVEDERRRTLVQSYSELVSISLSLASELRPKDARGAAELAASALATRKGASSAAEAEIVARVRREGDSAAIRLLNQLRRNYTQQSWSLAARSREGAAELKRLRQRAAEIEKQLAERSATYRAWRQSPAPAEIAAALPAGAALIDILRYQRYDLAKSRLVEARYAAVVYRRQAAPGYVDLGSAAAIDTAVRNLRLDMDNVWRNGANGPALISGVEFESNLTNTRADCARLHELTLAQLAPALGTARRLIISPDAHLAEIPWEAMIDRAGRYAIERGYRISYVDSARALVARPATTPPQGPIVVAARLGGGAQLTRLFDELRRANRVGPWRRLPQGSKEEVLALHHPLALIIHAHGFFHNSAETGIVLRDGWLTADEMMLMDLDGTRLTALLGCSTGRGAEAGEGVQGLRHALAVAGSRATLLTLWDVGDLSVAQLLRETVVRAVKPGATLAGALADARLALLRGEAREAGSSAATSRWRHPYFWAGLTLAGDAGPADLRGPAR